MVIEASLEILKSLDRVSLVSLICSTFFFHCLFNCFYFFYNFSIVSINDIIYCVRSSALPFLEERFYFIALINNDSLLASVASDYFCSSSISLLIALNNWSTGFLSKSLIEVACSINLTCLPINPKDGVKLLIFNCAVKSKPFF